MILLTSSDGGLLMGLFLSIIFSLTFIWGTIASIKIAIKPKNNENRKHHILYSAFALLMVCGGLTMTYTEYNLLYNFIWVEGTIIGKCSSKGSGQSYEFEYFVDGKRYTNCNSSGNVKGIKYPKGIYKVRVSRAVPSIGRIDYEQEIKTNNTSVGNEK